MVAPTQGFSKAILFFSPLIVVAFVNKLIHFSDLAALV